MKKILIFADSFLPGFKGGGPITSVSNLVQLLHNEFDILICTKNHDFSETKLYKDVVFDQITKYEKYNIIYLSKMDKISISEVVNDFNPDLLYLNSFFSKTTQIVAFLNRWKYQKKLIVAPRGELQENALKIKKLKKSVYLSIYKFLGFYKNIYFHSTDTIETKSIKNIFGIDNITQLQNAVKIHNYTPLSKNKNELKIIFVSRVSKKKNLYFAINLLLNISSNITFDIYGPKEDIKYWEECEDIIMTLPQNISVSYKGSLNQSEIVPKMREYHVFLFPTLSENFGHVIVEAMQAGLVSIISDQTPWLDLEEINAGWDINLSNKKKYIKVIEELYIMNKEEYSKKSVNIMNYIHNKLDMNNLKLDYIDFFNRIIDNKGEINNVQK